MRTLFLFSFLFRGHFYARIRYGWLIGIGGCGLSVVALAQGMAPDSSSSIPQVAELKRQDIIVTASFKPTIRNSSKIAFLPDLSSSLDTLPNQQYTYKLQIEPGMITHYTNGGSIASVGVWKPQSLSQKTQYLFLGGGNNGVVDGRFHLDILPKLPSLRWHAWGNLYTMSPQNRIYRTDYDIDLGTLARINVRKKYELGVQYSLETMRVRTRFTDQQKPPAVVQIPHIYHNLRFTFGNQKFPNAHAFFFDFQAGLSTFATTFSKPDTIQQSEVGFFVALPLNVPLSKTLKLNAKATFESFFLENISSQEQAKPKTSFANHITKGSLNLEYFKNNITAYAGASLYNTSRTSFSIYPELFIHFGMGKASPFFIEALFTTRQYYQGLYDLKQTNAYIKSDSAFGVVTHLQAQVALQYNIQKRFNLRLSGEWNRYENINLITNDWSNPYGLFKLAHEQQIDEFVIRNDYIYVEPEKYEFGLTVTKTLVLSQKTWTKPLGRLYPTYEVYGIYFPFKRLKLRTTFRGYDQVFYQDEKGNMQETPTGIYDLGFYTEYALLKKQNLRLWIDLQNILASPYERWKDYRHPGFLFSLGAALYL